MKLLTDEEFTRMTQEYEKVRIKCKHCGRKAVIPIWKKKQLCRWCGYYVYRDKKLEFEENLKNKIKENNNE